MSIAPGQEQLAPRRQNFDVNRNVLSFHSFVASFKTMSLKSDFIQFFFHDFFFRQPPGDKIFMSTERPYYFTNLLQVSKKSL